MITRVCHAVSLFETRADTSRRIGGPCLFPLETFSNCANRVDITTVEPEQVKRPEGDNGEDLNLAKLGRWPSQDVICGNR